MLRFHDRVSLGIPKTMHIKILLNVYRCFIHNWFISVDRFAGNCIGENNQRYFLVMCSYLWSVAVIENLYNLQFVCEVCCSDYSRSAKHRI